MKKQKIKVLLSFLVVAVMCIGGTMAFLHDSDSPLVNTFKLAQVDTDIEEGGETGEHTAESKDPVVKNSNESPVYVRARVNLSDIEESDVTVVFNTTAWENGNDGFWYYKQILKGGEKTEPLFTDLEISDTVPKDATFDVLVYQESILAPAENIPVNIVEGAKEAFAKKG